MSTNIYIGDKCFNMTWNVSQFFYDHIPAVESEDPREAAGGWHAFHGKTGTQAIEIINEAYERIEHTRNSFSYADGARMVGERDFCEKYDPPNGWGSTVHALVFLGKFAVACAMNPSSTVRVS